MCRREAPGVEQFARDHGDKILVVGLGTQDDLALAEDFVARTGIVSFQMLWDESFDSWAELGVVSQPAWGLFSASGEFLEGGYGGIDPDSLLEKATAL